ncbi:bifunctional metallophosphatase/5'-nucleotidase [Leuconostoc rapi]|uniref:bifunctional metallophosphatase/5'-nucleotidase n=1 Tax=Leuconostoc rapi TaxID=1406906 RepID=UPI001955F6F2|nr:bifunctional UDP-sugar hydrolase/5'-nucleotidase [Leuconostoc rapi]MBM7435828.1 2',3'-cyclic-nucleotide 2'-phosphodiesterase (5'-nucleotidase family) [Leuconostoc rapi]
MLTETIHLLHTNDMHSHFENWPRILRFLSNKQIQYSESYTFDIGDAIDRLNPFTDATMGQGNVALMNDAHYDGVTIGNNEGLVLSHDAMNHLYDDADFDVILSNLKEEPNQTQPKWAQNYKIIQTAVGTKLAIFALTAPYDLTYPALGWYPQQIDETIDKLLPLLHQQADVVILLSHLGLPTDEHIGEKYDIDVIIGAHTHHLLPHGKLLNGSLLAAAGRYGENVGDITLSLSNHHILNKQAVTTPIYEIAESDEDYTLISGWLRNGQKLLEKKHVTTLPRDLTTDEQNYDALRALKKYFNVPAAMVSSGMFVDDLPKGDLSQYELLESMPHAINPMLITLTGQEIKTLFEEIDEQQSWLATLAMKGSGFRGKVFGYIRFSGIDRQRDGQILYQGKPLENQKQYNIATLDHYKWVPFFPIIQQAPAKIQLDILLRELMAQYYQEKYSDTKHAV